MSEIPYHGAAGGVFPRYFSRCDQVRSGRIWADRALLRGAEHAGREPGAFWFGA